MKNKPHAKRHTKPVTAAKAQFVRKHGQGWGWEACPICGGVKSDYCSNGGKLMCVKAWWETKGTHSIFKCPCDTPAGADARDMLVYRCRGWLAWQSDSKAPALSKLDRDNPRHQKYI